MSAGDERACGGAELLPEVCSAISSETRGAGDGAPTVGGFGKGDDGAGGAPELRGVLVERVGDWTYFKIPLAYTVGGDRRRLLDETVHEFTARLGELNREMSARGVDLSVVTDAASREEFDENYLDTLDAIFHTGVESEMEIRLGESYARPRELWAWQRYLLPQAFIGYFSTKFTANLGIGGGVSATILVVMQPWLSLAVDHTAPEPTVVDKAYELDVDVMGVPNVDVGFGVGGGIPVRIGAGAIFGPLDRPEDLSGWGVGISGSATLPLVGGGQAKLITVLRHPPLFLAMAGYSSGTTGGPEVHGNLQYVMDLDEFLSWIGSLTHSMTSDSE